MKAPETEGKDDTWVRLTQCIDTAYAEAEMFAKQKENSKLLAATEWLGRAAELDTRMTGLLRQAERLISERSQPLNGNANERLEIKPSRFSHGFDEPNTSKPPGGKARANEYRGAYLAREMKRGNVMTRVRSIYFKNEVGTVLGITWKGKEKEKWFLNLQDGQFDEAVLLCETHPESAQVIHLPKPFFGRYSRHLSMDGKGQVKFNVERQNGRFLLQVPGFTDLVDVMDYLDNEPLICPLKKYV